MQNRIRTHNPAIEGFGSPAILLSKGTQKGAFLLIGYEMDLELVIRGLLVPVLALLSDGSRGIIRDGFSLYGDEIKHWNL